jgi:hypothetical protein
MTRGRPKGSKNKATIERELLADLQRARMLGPDRLAKDVIEYFMNRATAYAMKYEPKKGDLNLAPPLPIVGKEAKKLSKIDAKEWREKKFREWSGIAVSWAKELAPYESPTYRSIEIAPLQVDEEDDTVVLTTMEQVRAELLKYGVPPDEFARALLGPVIEHEPLEKLK